MRRVVGAACALATIAGCAVPFLEESTEAAVAAQDTQNLLPGRGYDRVRDQVADFCLDNPVAHSNPLATGQTVMFMLERIDSSNELSEALGISASASARFGAFGGDAKTTYAESRPESAMSVLLVVKAQVQNASRMILTPKLSASAAATLRADPAAFRRRCGDGFISSSATGGAFYGIIELVARTADDKRAISAALGRSGATWSAEAEFSNTIRSVSMNRQLTLHTFQEGGHADAITSIDEMIASVKTIPTAVAATGEVVVATSVMSYDQLALPEDAPSPPIDTATQVEVERALVRDRNDTRDSLALFRYAIHHPSEFEPFDLSAAQSAADALTRNFDALRARISSCFDDYVTCVLPDLERVSIAPPEPKGSALCTPGATVERKEGSVMTPMICSFVCDPRGEWLPAKGAFCVRDRSRDVDWDRTGQRN